MPASHAHRIGPSNRWVRSIGQSALKSTALVYASASKYNSRHGMICWSSTLFIFEPQSCRDRSTLAYWSWRMICLVRLTDRGPRFKDATRHIAAARADDVPLIVIVLMHDGPGPALAKQPK